VTRESAEVRELADLNRRVLAAFGMDRGASHTEFLRDRTTDAFYFLETSARVGGASVTDLVEAAAGINLWEEWATVEARGDGYTLPARRGEYGGVVVSLARQEWPDTSSFNDPEICYRVNLKHHVGLVVRSPSSARVDALLEDYIGRIARDYH